MEQTQSLATEKTNPASATTNAENGARSEVDAPLSPLLGIGDGAWA